MELAAILSAIAASAPSVITDLGDLWGLLQQHASGVPVTTDQITAAQATTGVKRKLIDDDIASN